MKKYINKNIKWLCGLIAVCVGTLECYRANGFLGYLGGILIIIGGIGIAIQNKKLNSTNK